MRRVLALLLSLLLSLLLCLSAVAEEILCEDGVALTDEVMVEYGYEYISRDEVALYLHCFCELPVNYISKNAAQALGWDGYGSTLWTVCPGKSLGGSRFGNYEALLPEENGRRYYECDIDYDGGNRNAERLVFSNDGLIYYTGDHYASFELLYEGWFADGAEYIPADN